MISEEIELLGKGTYKNIPDKLTLNSIPTTSELDYVGAEDFEATMVEKILPQAIAEKGLNFKELLEIDFQWICRCLRILNYGPYHTTNAIFCSNCGKTHYGEARVDLRTVGCKPLPEGFVNDIVISKDEFIDYTGDIHIKLPTIQDAMNAMKDKQFELADGRQNRELARMCYMIKEMNGQKGLTPVDVRLKLKNDLSAADFIILKNKLVELADYGLRAGGTVTCPKCRNDRAAFIALVDDKFFRPTLGDLREWKNSRSAGKA